MTFSKKIFDQMRTEDPKSPSTAMINSIRLTSFALMIDDLRKTIDHIAAGTAPLCDVDDLNCDQKMVLDLSVYEWRCPVCEE